MILPLEVDELLKLMDSEDSKNETLAIDYENSELKSRDFMNYVTNLGLKIKLENYDNVSKEEMAELIHAYMGTKCLIEPIAELDDIIATALVANHLDDNINYVYEFNKTRIDALGQLIREIPLAIALMESDIAESLDLTGVTVYEELDEKDTLIYNGIGVLLLDDFVELYISIKGISKEVNKEKFLTPIYKNNSLYNFLTANDFSLFQVYTGLMSM